jgi:hypothetical protein
MAFETVTCKVVFRVSVTDCDGSGCPNGATTRTMGDYETKDAAHQALIDNGFTRKEWGTWVKNYQHGGASRILIEIPT